MLIAAISLFPAYIFAAGNVLNDEKLDKAISNKIEQSKRIYEESQERQANRQLPYMAMRYYIDKDDGEGLKKYVSKYKNIIKPDDFYDVYRIYLEGFKNYKYGTYKYGKTKRHKFCYALYEEKYNVAKALVDLDKLPAKSCPKKKVRTNDYSDLYFLKRIGDEPYGKIINTEAANQFEEENLSHFEKYADIYCYALKQDKFLESWQRVNHYTTLPAARNGKCLEAYFDKMPVETILHTGWVGRYTANEVKTLLEVLEKRNIELTKKQLGLLVEYYSDNKEVAEELDKRFAELNGKEWVKPSDLRASYISEKDWQKLIEQKEDEFSFAKQSIDVLSKLLYYNNFPLNYKETIYGKAIKELDDAYKKYVKSLGGISVPKNAKSNYELTKQVLTDGMAQLEQTIAEEKEQKKIAAEKAKKEAAETKEEKFRKDFLNAFKGNEEKAEIFLNSVNKNIDKNKDFSAMYFPNGAKVCFTWQFGPDCTEYITPILVVYQDIKWDSYRQVFDGTSSDETYNWGYNVYIYNAEGKLIEKKEKTTYGLDVKDRKEPEKYKLIASKGGWDWTHRGGC